MSSPAQVTRRLEAVRGGRYGEILLVKQAEHGLIAEVFNTFTLNDCPQDLWEAMDLEAIAREEGALLALANGPRYWAVDTIEKVGTGVPDIHQFGGLAMNRAAVLELGEGFDPSPYLERTVARTAAFTFDAGKPVYELTSTEGTRYVMQAWCVSEDPTLTEANLASLGDRLVIPAGWRFRVRIPDEPIWVNTTTESATVIQDELRNTYSRLS
jgi:hypothetical protein